ncbi:MAG TPA: TIGR03619 family F420-dependent LLM class oxidoreductase [Acidimicrobiales bacterium]|jgi:probable F420-dependent oxidoreductase|nr:TIGR03619 family F420-dependent LLM class oxidoreductase [Acidimicrobiales bacterium]
MRIGLSTYNIRPGDLVELARAADDLGFASLWLGEHVVLPVDYASEHPTTGTAGHQHHSGPIVDPNTKLVDPLVALAGCAAVTSRIQLATGIYLAALRPPMITARMGHTLQDLSHGRLVLGLGAGWLEEEFVAVGVPFAGRGARLEEVIDVVRKAWAGGPFEHRGEHYQVERVQLCEEPMHVPLILGGNTDLALRRAARLGDGWFASGTPAFSDAVRWRDQVVANRDALGIGGAFPIYVRVPEIDPDAIERYEREGFDHVMVWADQVWPADADPATKRAALGAAAERLGVHPHAPVEV